MPEGPSLIIFKELVLRFKGKKIKDCKGNMKADLKWLKNKKIMDIRTWGKQFFFCLPGRYIRIHFLMFGSYSVDEQTRPDKNLRLGLFFNKGSVFIYNCSVKLMEGSPDEQYDWEADVMSDAWNPKKARKKLKANPQAMVCDALLDQQIFSGVGNIIKNEVLYRIRVNPESRVGSLPSAKMTALIKEARNYCFDFLRWKRKFELKKHWLIHTRKVCKRCDLPVLKKYCGITKRRTFFCSHCQVKYG